MRPLAIAIAVSALIFTASAQNHGGVSGNYHIVSGVGRGGAIVSPPAGSIINPGLPSGLNLGNAWRGYGGSYRGRYGGGRGNGSGYGVLAYPVFIGASPYDYGYLPPGYTAPPPSGYYDDSGAPPPAQAPAVVINQNFIPDRAAPLVREYGNDDQAQDPIHNYQNMPPSQPSEAEATIYLIAFRDHTVVPALAWWLDGSTLKYVNLDKDINQASVDLIDRGLSKKLNAQRNIDFTLPPQ